MKGLIRQVELVLTPQELAEQFCNMDDEDQAQVLIEAAKIASGWGYTQGNQWFSVGRHLRTCKCSTLEARELVRTIASGIGEEDAEQ